MHSRWHGNLNPISNTNANSAVTSTRHTTKKKLQSTNKASVKHGPHAVVHGSNNHGMALTWARIYVSVHAGLVLRWPGHRQHAALVLTRQSFLQQRRGGDNRGVDVLDSQILASLPPFCFTGAKSGFEMCFGIRSQHLGRWGQNTPPHAQGCDLS